MLSRTLLAAAFVLLVALPATAQSKRKVILDQDARAAFVAEIQLRTPSKWHKAQRWK
jgi:hypothetical protein